MKDYPIRVSPDRLRLLSKTYSEKDLRSNFRRYWHDPEFGTCPLAQLASKVNKRAKSETERWHDARHRIITTQCSEIKECHECFERYVDWRTGYRDIHDAAESGVELFDALADELAEELRKNTVPNDIVALVHLNR